MHLTSVEITKLSGLTINDLKLKEQQIVDAPFIISLPRLGSLPTPLSPSLNFGLVTLFLERFMLLNQPQPQATSSHQANSAGTAATDP